MLSNVYFFNMEQSNDSRHQPANRSSPASVLTNGIRPHSIDYSYNYSSVPPPSTTVVQCSAYFISRVDLGNYTTETLKHTIDSVVSGPNFKGLKVKLSLPDDGLIINNVLDPSQSWMYKTSELLYFWRDPQYANLIIVITHNRANHHQTSGPYSATIFRLRGNESVQLFLRRAEQVFAQLSSRNTPKRAFEKSATIEHRHKHHRKHSSKSKNKSPPSPQKPPVPLPPPVTQAKSDSRQLTTTDSIFNLSNRRTFSETTVSSDTRTSSSKQLDSDEKMTTVSNHLPNEVVTELVRELKELRNDIAALKLETRITPVRSTSTSPLIFNETDWKEKRSSSQSEVDAETQTDISLMNPRTKINPLNRIARINKRRSEPSKRIYVNGTNNIGSNREESSSSYAQEGSQSTSSILRPHPTKLTYQNGTLVSTPKSMTKDSLSSVKPGEVVSFRSSLEDTIAPPENIYENLPIFLPIDSNEIHSTNERGDQQKGKPYLHITIEDDENSESQQEYLSHLFGPQNGISLLIPPESLQKKTISSNQSVFQHVLFSDHLTNPLFNVDKQLLANTIANQFGIDVNSPDLQKLMTNQPSFVHDKHTFANMVWQMTPEEESALCSPPGASNSTVPEVNISDSNDATAKPILKPKTSLNIGSKGRRISWNSTLD